MTNHIKVLAALTMALCFLHSCMETEQDLPWEENSAAMPDVCGEVLFEVKDTSAATKAIAPVTSLSSFYVTATKGSTESSVFSSVSFTKASRGSTYKGGRNWPSSDEKYHFYASNTAISGTSVKISDIDKDIVCAYLPSPTYKAVNALSFKHILARVGEVSLKDDVSELSNWTITLSYCKAGTYNIKNGSWSGTSSGDIKLSSGSNDLWIIPGTYNLTLSWKDALGQLQNSSGKVTLTEGKVTNITVGMDSIDGTVSFYYYGDTDGNPGSGAEHTDFSKSSPLKIYGDGRTYTFYVNTDPRQLWKISSSNTSLFSPSTEYIRGSNYFNLTYSNKNSGGESNPENNKKTCTITVTSGSGSGKTLGSATIYFIPAYLHPRGYYSCSISKISGDSYTVTESLYFDLISGNPGSPLQSYSGVDFYMTSSERATNMTVDGTGGYWSDTYRATITSSKLSSYKGKRDPDNYGSYYVHIDDYVNNSYKYGSMEIVKDYSR